MKKRKLSKNARKGIVFGGASLVMILIILFVAHELLHDHDDHAGHDHSEDEEVLVLSEDFVTEYNRVTGSNKTISEIREEEDAKSIKSLETAIKEQTGYEMDAVDVYCNFDMDLYTHYYNAKGDITCYYGNDANAIYFVNNKDLLTEVYDVVTSFYDYSNSEVEDYISDANKAISTIGNSYWQLFMIANSHPVLQVQFVEDNVLLGAYDVLDFNIISEYESENGESGGVVEYRYDVSDVTGEDRDTKESGTVLMNMEFIVREDSGIKIVSNYVANGGDNDYITTRAEDWIEYKNDLA